MNQSITKNLKNYFKITAKMFCITINNNHCDKIKNLDITVGLGTDITDPEFHRDNTQSNIAENPFYGEYTYIIGYGRIKIELQDEWIGFCQYRKFWTKDFKNNNDNSLKSLRESILNEIPDELKILSIWARNYL